MAQLSPQSKSLLAEAHRRRIDNEIAAVGQIAAANPERLRLGELIEGADTVFGFSLFFHLRTSAVDRPGQLPLEKDLPTPERIEARFMLDQYPDGPPAIGLLSERPLFLPAARGLPTLVEGRCPALVCTFRGRFSRTIHDLPFFVVQIFRALTGDPAVLNAPHDALNPRAAQWFLERRATLPLPFEPDLHLPSPLGSASPRQNFKLERLP